jgi:hypothetical protein
VHGVPKKGGRRLQRHHILHSELFRELLDMSSCAGSSGQNGSFSGISENLLYNSYPIVLETIHYPQKGQRSLSRAWSTEKRRTKVTMSSCAGSSGQNGSFSGISENLLYNELRNKEKR